MKKIALLTVLVLLVALPAAAGDSTFGKHWSSYYTGTADGANSAYLAKGGTIGISGKAVKVETANVTSDKAGSVVMFLTQDSDTEPVTLTPAAGATEIMVASTSGFDASTAGEGDYVAIYDPTTREFEVNRISSITTNTSFTLCFALANTYASTATIYELKSLGTLAVGNATKDWPSITVYGETGKMLGWVLDGTSSCSVNYIAGTYVEQN